MRRPTADHAAHARPPDLEMPAVSDGVLYDRGTETLLASWEAYAGGATGAAVDRLAGVTAAVFPDEPGRSVYNNAVLARDLAAVQRADAIAPRGRCRG